MHTALVGRATTTGLVTGEGVPHIVLGTPLAGRSTGFARAVGAIILPGYCLWSEKYVILRLLGSPAYWLERVNHTNETYSSDKRKIQTTQQKTGSTTR